MGPEIYEADAEINNEPRTALPNLTALKRDSKLAFEEDNKVRRDLKTSL
jgi:hypothetical protein